MGFFVLFGDVFLVCPDLFCVMVVQFNTEHDSTISFSSPPLPIPDVFSMSVALVLALA